MSTQRRRDDLEPLLSAPGLYDLVGADGPCPDPETIAAFADRGSQQVQTGRVPGPV